MKVLIVDENQADLVMMVDLLDHHGCCVVPAQSAVDGVWFITTELPDVILADLYMVEKAQTGQGTMLLAVASIYDIPIITVSYDSGIAGGGDEILGCAGTIPKPIDTRGFAVEVLRLARLAGTFSHEHSTNSIGDVTCLKEL